MSGEMSTRGMGGEGAKGAKSKEARGTVRVDDGRL
jgi:hypothetical protein